MASAIGPAHDLRRFAVPLQPKPFRMVVGTRPTDRWLLPGPDAGPQLARKRQLLAGRPDDVVAVLDAPAAAASVALAALVADAVGHPDVAVGAGGEPSEALRSAALAVQEDLCVMQRVGPDAGGWRLTAACVCFPGHWRLADKLGGDLDAIHDPVPGYPTRLATATSLAFDRIAAADGDIWERFNWTLAADDELFHPATVPTVVIAAADVPHTLWLRTERQTLRSLPDGHGVVFAIRTFLTPLGELTDDECAALGHSLAGVSDELARYRSALGYREAVQEWLRLRESA